MVAKSKRPQDDTTPAQREETEFRATEDAAYARHPSSSAPSSSSSSGVEATLAAILDQLQLVRDDLGEIRDTQAAHGDRLDLLFDNMSQMNTRIGRIASPQSRIGGFAHSSEHESLDAPPASGDDNDDACSSSDDDEMTTSP